MDEQNAPPSAAPSPNHHSLLGHAAGFILAAFWLRMAFALAVASAVFCYSQRLLELPAQPHFSGSLLLGSAPVARLLAAAIVLVAMTLLCDLIAGDLERDAGLFVGCSAMAMISIVGGPMRYVLFAAGGPGVFLTLAAETLILFLFVAIAWVTLDRVISSRRKKASDRPEPPTAHGFAAGLVALGGQTLMTAVAMTFLAQSDAKAQALGSVFVASVIGGIIARYLSPMRETYWYWLGPCFVGVIGFLVAKSNPDGWNIGVLSGTLSPLARPLPIDFATAGPAGALLGYWTARGWQLGSMEPEAIEDDGSNPDPTPGAATT